MGFACLSTTQVAGGSYTALFHRYERACKKYPGLLVYDEALQATIRAITDGFRPGQEGTDEPPSLSFDSLRIVTACLLDTNDRAANEILGYKADIWSNDQLFSIVKEYFDLSSKTLHFLYELQGRLSTSRDKLTILRLSIQHQRSEKVKAAALDGFRDSTGFTDNFISSLGKVIAEHTVLLEKLQKWKSTSEKGIRSLRKRRKVIYVMLVTVFVSARVCSILAAALQAPPVVVALPTAVISITSWGPLTSWIEKLWKGEEKDLEERVATARAAEKNSYVVIKELEDINILVNKLRLEMTNLARTTSIVVKVGDDNEVDDSGRYVFLRQITETFVERSGVLLESMEKLDNRVATSCSDIDKARSEILQRMKNGIECEETKKVSSGRTKEAIYRILCCWRL